MFFQFDDDGCGSMVYNGLGQTNRRVMIEDNITRFAEREAQRGSRVFGIREYEDPPMGIGNFFG